MASLSFSLLRPGMVTSTPSSLSIRAIAKPIPAVPLGGSLRLSASSIDEYRGTDVYLARAGYLRRIAVLPAGFGQGIYATVAYEVGDAWSVQTHNTFRQDGLAGVVAVTPFGVITVAGSVGDAGRRKIFFSLGRLF